MMFLATPYPSAIVAYTKPVLVHVYLPTVPSFNSCTKCVDSPGITHDHTLDCHQVAWAWVYG